MSTLRFRSILVYLNDGDWVEDCTALTEHFEGRMELLRWSERRSRSRVEPGCLLPSATTGLAFASLSADAAEAVAQALKRAA